ncbi:N-acetylmuramoyl-L-alanine amidase-like domain-containing protein [Flammeovirga pectinis]|uniref:N-acetylmuramoyl-L-alanine amidase-like domain-containing protein n=1 Tax=Flammeovirga pectinis TaxID=2494373 RepID=UPI00197A9046|nr:N-acetylmuramoyl-L-alanine amidase-like domain-containing protein [Flammeovirga pectinis]
MLKLILSIFPLLFITFSLQAQFICSNPSKMALDAKIKELNKLPVEGITNNEKLSLIGNTFLGQPYLEKTLEVGEKEQLVINFIGFDCTTYVESVLALTILYSDTSLESLRTINHYASILERIRYRDGVIDGYTSRLHYFTEWVRDNAKKGIIKDVTVEIGGTEYTKEINFMSTHLSSYKQLDNDKGAVEKIKCVEEEINKKKLSQIYINDIESIDSKIKSGDIISLVTKIKGLDVTHVGIAVREADGKIHLMHDSQSKGKVVITDKPLYEWLKNSKINTGITVARIN